MVSHNLVGLIPHLPSTTPGLTPGGWPIETIRIPPSNICKLNVFYMFQKIFLNELNTDCHVSSYFLFSSIYFADDCVYLYYVCTEKLGTWPNNKQNCIQLFENCYKSIENERKV